MHNLKINKKIQSNLNLIYKEIKKVNIKKKKFKGCLDANFIKEKKNFSSPPFQYFSINYLTFYKMLNEGTKKKTEEEVSFLLSLQNKDGSYDEWYKYERSFCTSSYTSFLISNLLLENDKLDFNLKGKLIFSLEKSFYFLKNKFNKNILNQNLAKLIFLQNYIKINNKNNKDIVNEFNSHLNRVYNFVINSDEYEYKGIDLGYLSVSLMLSAQILKKNNSKKIRKIFLKLIQLARNLTLNFDYFPSYIFSRSSRIFLIYGFYFAAKKKFIDFKEFNKIFKFYNDNFETVYNLKKLRYLSFFYSTDKTLVLLDKTKKFKKTKKMINIFKKRNDYIIFKNKNLKIFIYKKNPNLIALNDKGKTKILLCKSLFLKNAKYVPSNLDNIKITDSKIYLKQKFIKINNLKDLAFRYLTVISFFSRFKILNKLIDYFAKYLLIIKRKEINNFKKFRTISFKNKKILIKEIIISTKNRYNMKPSLEAHYFSPTSFLLNNEILKIKKVSSKRLYKMKKNVLLTTYEI